VRPWHWMSLVLLAALSLFAEFAMPHDAEHWWSVVPGFFMLFGFVGCLVIIFFSKALGKLFLQQDEDYYDDL